VTDVAVGEQDAGELGAVLVEMRQVLSKIRSGVE
jgi:hypothetical protein